jgi:hypothetical protein
MVLQYRSIKNRGRDVHATTPRPDSIPTPDALKITGMNASLWRNMMDRQQYRAAPPLDAAGRRSWDTNSLAALAWCDAMLTSGMKQPLVGGLAGDLLRAAARHPHAATFNVWAWENDDEQGAAFVGIEPPGDAPADLAPIFEIPWAVWKRRVEQAVVRFYARKAARRGR